MEDRQHRHSFGWPEAMLCIFFMPVTICFVLVSIPWAAKGRVKDVRQSHKLSQYRRRIRTGKLPYAKPVALDGTRAKPQRGSVSFLDLPPEIREHIYDYALGGPWIFQPGPSGTLRGHRPHQWARWQHIRSDEDPPSAALRRIVELGGADLKPSLKEPLNGDLEYARNENIIYGDLCTVWMTDGEGKVDFPGMMRTCRMVYRELLNRLYMDSTISLLGSDMVLYFTQNIGAEGLRRIRHVHLAISVPFKSWVLQDHTKRVEDTIRRLKSSLPRLQSLDVELAVYWRQPVDPKRFGAWLERDVFGQLSGLKNFVLKLTVFQIEQIGAEWKVVYRSLDEWSTVEYERLRLAVTSGQQSTN